MIDRPVDEMLRAAAGRKSAHMPGHKGRAPFPPGDPYSLDTTELPLTDNLWQPEGAVLEAERLYAEAAGAGCTLFLTGGSTAGIHCMLQLWAREGDTVILPRSAHLSAVNACILGGLDPVWIPARQTADGLTTIAEADALACMEAHPEAKAVLITRPDYFGGCIPLGRIAEKAHAMGMKLLADEAHGAHLPWMDGPASASTFGADAWVQSCHKTLPALTGTAVLHLRDPADRSRALTLLTREQSSSPSYLLVRSIDDARAWMEEKGRSRLRDTARAVRALRDALPGMGLTDPHSLWSETGYEFDPTRLVIDAPEGGPALEEALRGRGIDVEMADERRVVMIFTAIDEPEDIAAIGQALAALPHAKTRLPGSGAPCPLPEKRFPPRAVAMGKTELIPIREAEGRVSAVSAGLYPPGVPLFVPGEVLSGEVLRRLAEAPRSRRFGLSGASIECMAGED